MLSNGSKPTSYGAGSGSINSANLIGKTALSGMLGGNDNIWQSSRSNAGIPLGVHSETGSSSNHNVSSSNNNHNRGGGGPYQDNQSTRSKASKTSKASMHSSINN